MAWVEKGWYDAHWVPPAGIDGWLGQRPVYAWDDGGRYHDGYVEEPLPGQPMILRIVGSKEE
jgi:hypothetical protein